MGQCVSIEFGAKNADQLNQSHIANQSVKSNGVGQGKAKKYAQEREESSDAETSDEEMEALAENEAAKDPNFGKAQSPINIVTCGHGPMVIKSMTEEDFQNNPLRFSYPDMVRECTIINTGHTVQVNIPEHSKCALHINNKTYFLRQFHFHTPSEHTIDGEQYEMEMHLVHLNKDNEIAVLGFIFTTKTSYFQPTLALSKSRKYLIKKTKSLITGSDPVNQDEETDDEEEEEEREEKNDQLSGGAAASVPLDEADRRRSSVRQTQVNDFLAQFWDELPLKKTSEEIRLSKPISFDYLFETASKTFKKSVESNEIMIDMEIFQYDGSLTTPPFSEGVQWLLARKLHFINGRQLNKLSSCWGHHNNARECQEYCGRQVQLRTQSSMKGYFFQ